jgi:hypothetical protein
MAAPAEGHAMTSRTVRTLGALAAGLVLLLVVVRSFNNGTGGDDHRLLLPNFEAQAEELDEIRIRGTENLEGTTIRRGDSGWVVAEMHDYSADLAKLRQLVIAMSEAKIVEEKTSNPEFYERLGLADPDEGGNGTKVMASAGDADTTVIFGETAQGEQRYARVTDAAPSYLVDRNPELPQAPAQWLEPNVTDVPAGDINRIVITHADDERIELAKGEEEQADYAAVNLPEGRELTYASVGNGIAGALGDLTLEDVRPATGAEASTTTVFTTKDGLEVTVKVSDTVVEPAEPAEPAGDADEVPTADAAEDESAPAEPEVEHWLAISAKASSDEAKERADAINARVEGWEYRVPDYKAELLTKRWDDLLKPVSQDAPGS